MTHSHATAVCWGLRLVPPARRQAGLARGAAAGASRAASAPLARPLNLRHARPSAASCLCLYASVRPQLSTGGCHPHAPSRRRAHLISRTTSGGPGGPGLGFEVRGWCGGRLSKQSTRPGLLDTCTAGDDGLLDFMASFIASPCEYSMYTFLACWRKQGRWPTC